MNRVLVLADSRKYINNNCFQFQLHESIEVLKKNFVIEYFYLNPRVLQNYEIFRARSKSFQFVVSTLRQRILFENISLISKLIGDTPLKVYDQDPWESYIDESKTKGCYTMLQNNLQLSNIFVPSNYWANHIGRENKIKATFIKMGMLPRLCTTGASQRARRKSIEFKGSLHPHRQEAFSEMRKNGQAIQIDLAVLKYPKYLKYLQNLAIFVHDESGFWVCNGEKIPRSTGMWVKDIEIASQGCFSVRNFSEESRTYSVENIPLIKFYRSPSEVKSVIDEIYSLSEEQIESIRLTSVEYIASNNFWEETINIIFKN
jgi:hypothetical protein